MNPMSNSLYGSYRTRTFNDIYSNLEDFNDDFTVFSNAGLNPHFNNNTTINTLYFLLVARYGNSHIINSDENQFKARLFSYIFQYGPTWEKRLDIQSIIRNLSEDELLTGSKAINNHALNPSTAPSTNTLDELEFIDEQTSTKYKKSKMDAYANLMALLEKDVTEEFINKFKKLFIYVAEPDYPLYYITEIGGDE